MSIGQWDKILEIHPSYAEKLLYLYTRWPCQHLLATCLSIFLVPLSHAVFSFVFNAPAGTNLGTWDKMPFCSLDTSAHFYRFSLLTRTLCQPKNRPFFLFFLHQWCPTPNFPKTQMSTHKHRSRSVAPDAQEPIPTLHPILDTLKCCPIYRLSQLT